MTGTALDVGPLSPAGAALGMPPPAMHEGDLSAHGMTCHVIKPGEVSFSCAREDHSSLGAFPAIVRLASRWYNSVDGQSQSGFYADGCWSGCVIANWSSAHGMRHLKSP